jgi:hypothetical protein
VHIVLHYLTKDKINFMFHKVYLVIVYNYNFFIQLIEGLNPCSPIIGPKGKNHMKRRTINYN